MLPQNLCFTIKKMNIPSEFVLKRRKAHKKTCFAPLCRDHYDHLLQKTTSYFTAVATEKSMRYSVVRSKEQC